MAIAALICAVLVPPIGILMGHIAWAQTARTGQRGRGLALAALIIGYLELLVLCGVPTVMAGF
jgi:peptidyl-prolyl cis-trans isomerase B (cyclophilin B)